MSLNYTISNVDGSRVQALAQDLKIHPIIISLLVSRGISEASEINSFLNPDQDMLHDPYILPDMDKAVKRIDLALQNGEKILIHGDYDADGLTSTILLSSMLKYLKGNVEHFIPSRIEDGYGLKSDGIEFAEAGGAGLIITCDCGTSAIDPVAYANAKGIDIIITDHHEPDCHLPEALAIINPKRPDSDYPFKGLAGVGVAAKLIFALFQHKNIEIPLINILRICAIGTIADVVPLVDENRYIARHGLAHLAGTSNIGLKELFKASGLNPSEISSYDVGFRIAPRLNATGRFGKQSIAMELLITRDKNRAAQLAQEMNDLNLKRQRMVDVMVNDALEMVENREEFQQEKVIVVGDKSWHKGMVGLVASKLVETYHKPALAFSIEDGIAMGSGRSIPEFDMVENLGKVGHLFSRYGGHAMAAGFELPASSLGQLRKELSQVAAAVLKDCELVKKYHVDAKINLDDLDCDFVRDFKKLEPFGNGNENPVFLADRIQLVEPAIKIKKSHLKLVLKQTNGHKFVTAMAWNTIDRIDELKANTEYQFIFAINFNRWRNKEEMQMIVKDFAPVSY